MDQRLSKLDAPGSGIRATRGSDTYILSISEQDFADACIRSCLGSDFLAHPASANEVCIWVQAKGLIPAPGVIVDSRFDEQGDP